MVAVISTGLFYGLFVSGRDSGQSIKPTAHLVAASRDLDRGTVLKAEDLKLVPWAGGPPPRGSFSDLKLVNGQTLLEPVSAHELLIEPRLASAKRTAAGGVPSGSRVISIHVSDSAGVLGMLRPGHKVDIQAVYGKGGQPGGEPELRTILQNMTVVELGTQPEGGHGRPPLPVVTLLATPSEADLLALADSSARIRLLLRHPLDDATQYRSGLAMTALARPASSVSRTGEGASSSAKLAAQATLANGTTARSVSLWVRMASAGKPAWQQLDAHLVGPRSGDALQVSALQPVPGLERALGELEQGGQWQVLSSSRLLAGNQRRVSLETLSSQDSPEGGYGVRIQFEPVLEGSGKLRLRVQPEISTPWEGRRRVRRMESELDLADGQSILISGLADRLEGVSLVERLFPSRPSAQAPQELLVLVTPRLVAPTENAALRARR